MKSHEIKNILEERTIEVSEHSWEKLAGQLDANDRKKRSKKIYIPYAACLALLVSWLVFMMVQSEETTNTDEIANQENTTKPIITKTKENSQDIVIPTKEKIQEVIVKDTEVVVETNTSKDADEKEIVPKATAEFTTELQKEIKNAVVIQEKIIPQKIETVIEEKEVIITTNDDLKASIVALLKEEKRTVTNAEIDLLLKEARESLKYLEVTKEKVNNTNFATADELLNEVEYELDKSFKQRVFELVKRNVKRTRTADIDR
ncbi:hypothetical protein KORDIASMS9_02007 [Kordia sp. SMS9]|uniref:hypothetical protein n=1 Tax=Kordia sp. SMS9 TaxID=2282170 RepID=UPI000E0D4AD3|nr:hypothetical protein [Kordia sp. SMS9]AXG69780.1 hypothetical protein KORDIASMS9_02007 [Kordia sp. SMS9]